MYVQKNKLIVEFGIHDEIRERVDVVLSIM